jgi:hypothetical protein
MASEQLDLVACLARPDRLADVDIAVWDRLVPEARVAGLLPRLALLLEERGLLAGVPKPAQAHLVADRTVAEKHARDIRWEVGQIRAALKDVVPRFILLKGAAYVMADLPPSRGRLFSDTDVLVPKETVAAVEAALLRSGWAFGEIDPYDDRYYRRFTHQIPPMTHKGRRTTIDVHHTIVQVTARLRLEPQALWTAARDVSEGVAVLAPADMVLHSAVHLFNDGEFNHGLRDLTDITMLLRHFKDAPGFTTQLVERAVALDLVRPLYYALRYSRRLLEGPVSEELLKGVDGLPPGPLLALMDALFLRVLRSPHRAFLPHGGDLAGFLLYVRAHHLRMPLTQLIPHLVRKSYRREST